eukprot:scaffold38308_cov67-Phaeocystis_antarctica.AAC.5
MSTSWSAAARLSSSSPQLISRSATVPPSSPLPYGGEASALGHWPPGRSRMRKGSQRLSARQALRSCFGEHALAVTCAPSLERPTARCPEPELRSSTLRPRQSTAACASRWWSRTRLAVHSTTSTSSTACVSLLLNEWCPTLA